MRETEKKRFHEKIDYLTARLLDSQQMLEEKNEEVTKLTEKLSMVEEESENIPILKAQVIFKFFNICSINYFYIFFEKFSVEDISNQKFFSSIVHSNEKLT